MRHLRPSRRRHPTAALHPDICQSGTHGANPRSNHPQRPETGPAAEFWSQALGFTADSNPDFLIPPASARPTRLHLDETDRTHLDLWVDNSTLEDEVDRLIDLGAERVEDWTYPHDADFVVLRSPDGTVFCIIG